MFVADLSDMFPGGLYDTKYISDYITREQSSFLAYLFRKYERQDVRSSSQHKSKDTPDSKPVKLYSTFDVQGRLPMPPQPTRQRPTTTVPAKNANQPVFCEDYAVSTIFDFGDCLDVRIVSNTFFFRCLFENSIMGCARKT